MVYNIHKSYSAMADNACALAKFGRPKNACVFEGGRIWLSPHGRARLRAQLARAKPEEPPRGGGDAALTRLLSDAAATPTRGQGWPRVMSINIHKCLIYYFNFKTYKFKF